MSLLDFYWDGSSSLSPEMNQWDKARAYKIEPAFTLGKIDCKNPLTTAAADRITYCGLHNENVGLWEIDDAVLVRGPTDENRNKAVEYWNENYYITLIAGICSTVATIGCIAGAITIQAVWLQVVLSVAAVAFAFFAILSFYRCYDACEQSSGWALSPAEQIANLRHAFYTQGFFYFITTPMWRSLLQQSEVEKLYKQCFHQWNERLGHAQGQNDAFRADLAQQFLQNNPLEHYAASLVFGADKPHILLSYCHQFAAYSRDIRNIQDYVTRQKRDITGQKNHLISTQEEARDRELQPYKTILEGELQRHEQEKQAALSRLSPEALANPESQAVRAINIAYYDKVRASRERFQSSTLPIQGRFTRRQSAINREYRNAYQLLEDQTNRAMLPFFERAADLLKRAIAVLNDEQPPAPSYTSPFERFVQASAPPGGPEFTDKKNG